MSDISSHKNQRTLICRIWREGRQDRDMLIQHGTTLGCDSRNTIWVNGEDVESLHARVLLSDDGGLELVCENPSDSVLDCGKGMKVSRVRLDDGTRLMLGNTFLMFYHEMPPLESDVDLTPGSQHEPSISSLTTNSVIVASKNTHTNNEKSDQPTVSPYDSQSNMLRGRKRAAVILALLVAIAIPGYFVISQLFGVTGHDANAEYDINLEAIDLNRKAVVKEESEVEKLLGKGSEQNEANSYYILAEQYRKGEGLEKDEAAAVNWYRKAAEMGHPDAQFKLAGCYFNGVGVEKNASEAVKWAGKAAELGHNIAEETMGFAYDTGTGVAKDGAEAVKWYRKAADKGNANAQYQLALYYSSGKGVEMDATEGVRWARMAADQGHALAAVGLGYAYETGTGVAKDVAEARVWYRKAADHGYAEAELLQGKIYREGRGVTKDDVQAFKWFRKAAEQGNAPAQYEVGRSYKYGMGVESNEREAVKWFKLAADQGDANGQYAFASCFQSGDGVEPDMAEFMKWLRKAAEQGLPQAQWELGLIYFHGRGVAKDATEAVNWYRKAAEQGHDSAQYDLAQCLLNGTGVAKNPAEAEKWLKQTKAQEATFRLDEAGAQKFLQAGLEELKESQNRKVADEQDPLPDGQKRFDVFTDGSEDEEVDEFDSDPGTDVYDAASDKWRQAQRAHNQDLAAELYAEAVKLYRKAADTGDRVAEYKIGSAYWDGLGVKKNTVEAVKWYHKSAVPREMSEAQAELWFLVEPNVYYALGKCYANGEGVAKSRDEAIKWLKKCTNILHGPNREAEQLLRQLGK